MHRALVVLFAASHTFLNKTDPPIHHRWLFSSPGEAASCHGSHFRHGISGKNTHLKWKHAPTTTKSEWIFGAKNPTRNKKGKTEAYYFRWIYPSFLPIYKHGTNMLCWGYTLYLEDLEGKIPSWQHLRGTKRGTLWPDIGIGKIPLASSVTGCKLMTYETRDAMRFALWKRFSTHQEIRHPGKIRNSRSSNQKRPCPLYFVGMQKGSIFLRTNISPKALGMSFLSHWWNMLVPWRVQGGPLPVISRVMGPQ